MKIGDNIKEIREKEIKISKEDVATALGITTKAYSNIENNVADITLTRLQELSRIFDVTPEYILNFHEKATYTNNFNNYEGNQGVNIMYQGYTPEQIQNLEKRLNTSQEKLEGLKSSISAKNN